MTDRVLIRPGTYRDSVKLMRVSQQAAERDGVVAAVVAMATPLNLELLQRQGFDLPAEDRRPDDLVVAIRAADDATASAAVAAVEAEVDEIQGLASADPFAARSARHAVRLNPDLSLAFVSVPGRSAAIEVAVALDGGLDVFCFSDGVSLAAEVALKKRALERGLLLMGPDCGTALLDGVALGFANAVQRGPVGVVGASGTGIQELTCLLDAGGIGVSHAIGVGGRDMSEVVGGAMTKHALTLLDDDPATELVVVVTKPPGDGALKAVRARAAALTKPVMFALPGAEAGDGGNAESSIEGAATRVAARLGSELSAFDLEVGSPAEGADVRGLFCGGTLALEAMAAMTRGLGAVRSNVPLRPEWALEDVSRSHGHTVIDFGADALTEGRAHPVIDPSLRLERLRRELDDPQVGVVLLDVILGYGAHPDPAADLASPIATALDARDDLRVMVSLCGAEGDPQGLAGQTAALRGAGAYVTRSAAALGRAAVAAVAPSQVAP
jgi:FdrA protein